VRSKGKQEPLFQIVGLVKNTKYYQLREDFLPIGFPSRAKRRSEEQVQLLCCG
jgi:hypothetical protein